MPSIAEVFSKNTIGNPIKKAKESENLKDVIFCNISFGDANSMVKELENLNTTTKNIIFSQVVPSYSDLNIKAVKEYQTIMQKYFPNEPFGFLSLEAFLSSKVLEIYFSYVSNTIFTSSFFVLGGIKTSKEYLLSTTGLLILEKTLAV